ncbi:MAG: hypothetical protein JKP98_21700 [Rhodobacteraceae bacterium]|jgi:chromosome segregation ATPase|nr:hypothetical protein [Paracoccaceae bacterium]MBL4558728.1 hypothetical protein [Paracoccaceae bacterium]
MQYNQIRSTVRDALNSGRLENRSGHSESREAQNRERSTRCARIAQDIADIRRQLREKYPQLRDAELAIERIQRENQEAQLRLNREMNESVLGLTNRRAIDQAQRDLDEGVAHSGQLEDQANSLRIAISNLEDRLDTAQEALRILQCTRDA